MTVKARLSGVHKFVGSRRALAIPVTYLILFVTTLLLISFTYAFAIQRVNSQGQTLKVSTAKEDMISMDSNILEVASQPGSARVFNLQDSGGQINVEPSENNLTLSITDSVGINATIYNETIGQVLYDLPASQSADVGFYLEGDSRTISNQSGSVITQLSEEMGADNPELQLRYRPIVTCATAENQGTLAVNNVRIYVINMNTSDVISLFGKLPLRISCEATLIATTTYTVSYNPGSLTVTSVMNGANGAVSVPISSTPDGAVINVQLVECTIKIARSII